MESSRWSATGVSVIGARHIHVGQPCQDSVRFEADEEMVLVAVADGHGDPRHGRSQEGSQIAVEVACGVLRALGEELLDDPRPALQVQRSVREHLPRRIVWEWNRRVKALAGVDSDGGTWHEITELFGTTLLATLVIERLVIFFQLGDGDILLTTGEGPELVTVPDTELWGNMTRSLCQQDASSWVQISVRTLDAEQWPRLIVLSTDGVRDCLGTSYEAIGERLEGLISEKGWETMVDDMPGWLSELSERGNGDDATLALVAFDEQCYLEEDEWGEE